MGMEKRLSWEILVGRFSDELATVWTDVGNSELR